MDPRALREELQALQREKDEAKQRLEAIRPHRFGDRLGPRRDGPPGRPDDGPRGPGDRPPLRSAGSLDGGRGRGIFSRLAGGMGGPGGRGSSRDGPPDGMGPPAPRGGGFREAFQHDDRVRGSDLAMSRPPPRRARLQGDHDDRDGSLRFGAGDRTANGAQGEGTEAPAPKRRWISSAVVATDNQDTQPSEQGTAEGEEDNDRWNGSADAGQPSPPRKRAAPEPAPAPADDERQKKRNRRMFGMLLGTLQRFREEDAQFSNSDVAAKRSEALRKAEERERLQSQELRRKAARERDAMRDVELAKLSELSLATDTKVLELLYASRVTRKEQLARFLVTKTHPPVHWLPAVPIQASIDLEDKQREELEQWKTSALEELEREKQALIERSTARREAALARRAAREERLAAIRAGTAMATDGDDKALANTNEEDNEEETLAVGEYAVLNKEAPEAREEGETGDGPGEADTRPGQEPESGEADAAVSEDPGMEEDEDAGQEGDKKEPVTVEDLLS